MFSKKKYSKDRKYKIKNFRNGIIYNVFCSWSPYKRGLIFHNFLLNYFYKKNKNKILKFKKKINNLNIGNPPAINIKKNYYLTYDDCLSFEEYEFLNKKINKRKINLVIEIGPGYGRLVEMIIKNFKLTKYFCIDYKSVLNFTKKYLSKVLNKEEMSKVIFINFEDFNFKKNFFKKKYNINYFDLLLNSDSFHEMENKIILKYLRYFGKISNNAFFKNAFAKYSPQLLHNHLGNDIIPKHILNLGLMKKKINIFDSLNCLKEHKKFLIRYSPYPDLKKVYSKISDIYPNTALAFFEKKRVSINYSKLKF